MDHGLQNQVPSQAYVALLHGAKEHFWIYALLLGRKLQSLDPHTPRYLLGAKHASPFFTGTYKECLETFWNIQYVELVDVPQADKTLSKRHRHVFTKLRLFELRVSKILFFDLDVLVVKNPKELFTVSAPAGMYHGPPEFRCRLRHGHRIPRRYLYNGAPTSPNGCVNAGLLRIDLPTSETDRNVLLRNLLECAHHLTEGDQSYLPEQYFLVQKLSNWSHIGREWNWEVSPQFYPSSSGAVRGTPLRTGGRRFLGGTVGMYHFSGSWEPWWYILMKPQAAFRHLKNKHPAAEWLAASVRDWLQAVDDFTQYAFQDSDSHGQKKAALFQAQLKRLKVKARSWVNEHNWRRQRPPKRNSRTRSGWYGPQHGVGRARR